jgi:hypothetical protein
MSVIYRQRETETETETEPTYQAKPNYKKTKIKVFGTLEKVNQKPE